MILECAQCKRLYDASGSEPGTPVACDCSDVLLVPDLDTMEGDVLIENYMKRLAREEGFSPEQISRGEGWELQRGSARIHVDYDKDDDLLTIESAILPMPHDNAMRARLFQRVLELNHRSTGEARFAILATQVVVTFTRSAAGLDYAEFHRAIESVCRTADDYDEELRSQFLSGVPVEDTDEVDLGKL